MINVRKTEGRRESASGGARQKAERASKQVFAGVTLLVAQQLNVEMSHCGVSLFYCTEWCKMVFSFIEEELVRENDMVY